MSCGRWERRELPSPEFSHARALESMKIGALHPCLFEGGMGGCQVWLAAQGSVCYGSVGPISAASQPIPPGRPFVCALLIQAVSRCRRGCRFEIFLPAAFCDHVR